MRNSNGRISWWLLLSASLSTLAAGGAGAAPIHYGDFAGATVMYLDVTETANTPGDVEPLYGAPNIVGDQLDFDPAGFAASASGGASDLTDGQLNLTLMGAGPGHAITSIFLRERGDYSLLGSGTGATQIHFALSVASVTVLEVDGAALLTPVTLSGISGSGGDDLANGTDALSPWSLALLYDVNAALGSAGVSFVFGATKLELVLDNFLATLTEPQSLGFVAKKDFSIEATTIRTSRTTAVPEPGSLALIGMALGALHVLGRRRA